MRHLLQVLLCGAILCYTAELGAQCLPTNNFVCNGNPSFVSRGNKPATDQWKSVTVTQTGFHYFTIYDSALGLSNTNELIYELKTCGTGKIQLHCQQYGGYVSSTATKQNADNNTCGGGAYNEHMFFTGQSCVVHILGDSCYGTTDTFTLYYRVFCRPLISKSSYGNQMWRNNIYNSGLWTLEKYSGSYGHESKDFTRTFTNGQPDSVSGYCAMCPGGGVVDTNYYTAEYRMNWWQGSGMYKIVCNTPLRLSLGYHGGQTLSALDYTYGTQPSQKFAITKLDSISSSVGKWEYRVYKETQPFKADISICKMEGDMGGGNSFWKAYVHDNVFGAPPEYRITNDRGWNNYYQGTFNTAGPVFGYNWNGIQPPMTGERCGQTMDNDSFRLDMKMNMNLQAGNYKFRVRCSSTPQLIVSTYTVILSWPFSTACDLTSSSYYFNGNTSFNLNAWHRAGPHYLSFNYARQPKNVGTVSVAVIGGTGDTVCAGSSVTLTADTVDGTQLVWYIKCTGTGSSISCANGILVGTGNSITVTPDSSTTYFVKNRNLSVAADDTLNKLDLYSAAWATRRITRVALPQAPTTPASKTICSDTAYTFVWDSVYAGIGGNAVEYKVGSGSWQAAAALGSGRWQVQLIVASGATDTIWVRSKNSTTGCVSGSVWMTGSVKIIPGNPTIGFPKTTIFLDTISFAWDSIGVGINGDSTQYAYSSTFLNYNSIGNMGSFGLSVEKGRTDTVWMRTLKYVGGCISSPIQVTLHAHISDTTCPGVFHDLSADSVYSSDTYWYHKTSSNGSSVNCATDTLAGQSSVLTIAPTSSRVYIASNVSLCDTIQITLWSYPRVYGAHAIYVLPSCDFHYLTFENTGRLPILNIHQSAGFRFVVSNYFIGNAANSDLRYRVLDANGINEVSPLTDVKNGTSASYLADNFSGLTNGAPYILEFVTKEGDRFRYQFKINI